MSGSNYLVIVSGSIAAYKACDVVSQLVQRGHRVRCVLTASAARFVGAATLEGLTGQPVATDLFASGDTMAHIELTRWADAVLVCPATASLLNRFAAGLADDLAGALFLARDRTKPWVIAPAMNPAMWSHPATVESVAKLRGWGLQFVPVGEGRTACGETGEGRLAEPATIVAALAAARGAPGARRRVLVTAGGTAEPIDGVRVLANTSTGATGARIADEFARAGHEVVLLRARSAVAAGGGVREETFFTFQDLESALRRLLAGERFDVVIHAAAVSDYAVDLVVQADGATLVGGVPGKIASGGAPVLRLRSNPRLVDALRGYSAQSFQLVAFKLTYGATENEIRSAVTGLFAHSGADFVVHNDLAARGADGSFPADILRPDGSVAVPCADRATLAEALVRLLGEAGSEAVPAKPAAGRPRRAASLGV